MKKNYTAICSLIFLAIIFNGCINVNQVTVINMDGSGTINLHYWTKSSNISTGGGQDAMQMGDDIGGFSFVDGVIKEKYNTPVTEIKEMKRYNDDNDTTTHISLLIAFKDFNKLSEAPGFAKTKTKWAKGEDGMDFEYIIAKDTTIQKRFIQGGEQLNYAFEFPDKVEKSNGVIDGNKAKWSNGVGDLADGSIDMTATIKTKSKICAMFGFELPVVVLLGLFFINRKKILKRNNK